MELPSKYCKQVSDCMGQNLQKQYLSLSSPLEYGALMADDMHYAAALTLKTDQYSE